VEREGYASPALVLFRASAFDHHWKSRKLPIFRDFPYFFCRQPCMNIRRSPSRCCPYPDCSLNGQFGKANIIRHSFYTTSHASRISHGRAFLPKNIHGGISIFFHCNRHKKSWIGFRTTSAEHFEGVVKTQQQFPGEAPKMEYRFR
jgi:hypothetical protein